MYTNYKNYMNNRIKIIKKLDSFVPGLPLEMIIDMVKTSKKHSAHFDKIKKGIEKSLGQKIEYAEVDIIVQLIASTAMQQGNININGDVDKMTKEITKYIGTIIPGFNTKEICKDAGKMAKKLVNHILEDE